MSLCTEYILSSRKWTQGRERKWIKNGAMHSVRIIDNVLHL